MELPGQVRAEMEFRHERLVLGGGLVLSFRRPAARLDLQAWRGTFGAMFLETIRSLTKSKSDCMLGGVCGGLGAHTPIPAWIWRVLFLVLVLFVGTGGIIYVILWIALPDEKPPKPDVAGPPPA